MNKCYSVSLQEVSFIGVSNNQIPCQMHDNIIETQEFGIKECAG